MPKIAKCFLSLSTVLLLGVGTSAAAQQPAPAPAPAGAPALPLQYLGFVVNMGGPGPGSWDITLHADEFTSASEVSQLVDLLRQQGLEAIQKAMWKMKSRGYIKIGNSLGYQVPLIRWRIQPNGNTLLTFITDRPIQFVEFFSGTRSLDYPFGMVLLEIEPSGKASGLIYGAMKATFDASGKVDLESYGTAPYKIINTKKTK